MQQPAKKKELNREGLSLGIWLWMGEDERGHSSSTRVDLLHFYLMPFYWRLERKTRWEVTISMRRTAESRGLGRVCFTFSARYLGTSVSSFWGLKESMTGFVLDRLRRKKKHWTAISSRRNNTFHSKPLGIFFSGCCLYRAERSSVSVRPL